MDGKPGEKPVAGEPDSHHGQGIAGIGQSRDQGQGVQRVAEVDGGPVGCRAFAQHVGKGDTAQHNDGTLKHATPPSGRALGGFGVARVWAVGDHPGRKPPDD